MHHFENTDFSFIPKRPGIYVVGGTVRDCLLGFHPKDYDIACFEPPEKLAEEIASAAGGRPVKIGKGEKAIHRIVTSRHTYDISAGTGQSIEDDLKRRDFTVNAMAIHMANSSLIDVLNGREDLSGKIIRQASPSAFKNDSLRLLRAFRIAAGLDFTIEENTFATIRQESNKIDRVAGERIREEWFKMLDTPRSIDYIEQMDAAGLLCALFPELLTLKDCLQNRHHSFDVFTHSLRVYRFAERLITENHPCLSDRRNTDLLSPDISPALVKHAALLHDIGKPLVQTTGPKGNIHFYGHGRTGSEMSRLISSRLRMANREQTYVDFLIRNHLRPLSLYISATRQCLGRMALARFFRKTAPYSTDLVLLATADMLGKKRREDNADYLRFANDLITLYQEIYRPVLKKPPLITGHDLIRGFNLSPGPLFADILKQLEISRLAGVIKTREDAMERVEKILESKNHT